MFNRDLIRPAFRYVIVVFFLLTAYLIYSNVHDIRRSWDGFSFPTAGKGEEETVKAPTNDISGVKLSTSSSLTSEPSPSSVVTELTSTTSQVATPVESIASVEISLQSTSSNVPTTLSTVTLASSIQESSLPSPSPSSSSQTPTQDGKVIVIAHLQSEDTSWVEQNLPDWQRAIYVVDNTSAPLHVDKNKGREANVYLTYVIQNYDNLPKTIVFLHPHRNGFPQAWHNDAPNYDNVISMKQLRLDFVQKNGYANLRCNPSVGCPNEVQPFRNPPDPSKTTENSYAAAWKALMRNEEVPKVVGVACCSQFAVSREQVLKRPKADYEHYIKWLMDTELDDDTSGRVFEYMWHVIYGKDAVYCPPMGQCGCDVYGRC